MAGSSVTVGNLAALTIGGDNGSTTFAGRISGGGGLTKTGSGTFTLSGANTYTGLTNIVAGTLQIGIGGSGKGLASFTVGDSGTLAFNHADALTFSGAITGSGGLDPRQVRAPSA